MTFNFSVSFSLLLLGVLLGESHAAEEPTELLRKYCVDCHGPVDEFPEGDFSLSADFERLPLPHTGSTLKKALQAVEGQEMPPADADQPSPAERLQLASGIRQWLGRPTLGRQRNPGKPVLRRLTRLEYNNTVRDLLGLQADVFMFPERLPFDKSYFVPAAKKLPDRLRISAREYGAKYPVLLPEAGLPGDSRAEHGFTNRGDTQNLSPTALSQYVQLAHQIAFHPELLTRAERMQELFPNARFQQTPGSRQNQTRLVVNSSGKFAPNNNITKTAPDSASTFNEFRQRLEQAFLEDRGGVYEATQNNTVIAGKGGVLHLAYGKNANRVLGVNPSEDIWNAAFATGEESSGEILFTNRKKGLKQFFFAFQRSGDNSFRGVAEIGLVVLSRRGQAGIVNVIAEFEEEQTTTVTVNLKEGAGNDNTFVSLVAPPGKTIRRLRIDGSGFSGDYVLLDDLAFITRDKPAPPGKVTGREQPPDNSKLTAPERKIVIDRSIARQSPRNRLAHFVKRAFRRPVSPEEVELYFGLYQRVLGQGDNDEQAMRTALQGVLSSPTFLYRMERGLSPQQTVSRLTDYELASRLSYFLWSSLPDDELFALAEQGTLHEPPVLEAQVKRMLRDPRVRELSENFFVEWLRLRELWSAQPEKKQFPSFYSQINDKRTLARDLFLEPLLQFETVLIEDRPILELIDADYTWVNQPLTKLYELQSSANDDRDWVRVSLEDSHTRGGILTTGAVLTLTSFPHRTSPIRRGAWFLETVFHRPPPPPKVAVADIDEQENVEHLSLRKRVELHRAKAACAVCHDRIDPPGFALENFDAIGRWRVKDGKETIEPGGKLQGIGPFKGPNEFKKILLQDRHRFARGFTEQLLSYALARKLEYYDVSTVEEIRRAAEQDDYRLSRFVLAIVRSDPFQQIHLTTKP